MQRASSRFTTSSQRACDVRVRFYESWNFCEVAWSGRLLIPRALSWVAGRCWGGRLPKGLLVQRLLRARDDSDAPSFDPRCICFCFFFAPVCWSSADSMPRRGAEAPPSAPTSGLELALRHLLATRQVRAAAGRVHVHVVGRATIERVDDFAGQSGAIVEAEARGRATDDNR